MKIIFAALVAIATFQEAHCDESTSGAKSGAESAPKPQAASNTLNIKNLLEAGNNKIKLTMTAEYECSDCCDGDNGDACTSGTESIGDGSCNAINACLYAIASIGMQSCNQHQSCIYSSGTIGNHSCNGRLSCWGISGNIGNNSCNENADETGDSIGGACYGYDGDIPNNCPSVAELNAGNCVSNEPSKGKSSDEPSKSKSIPIPSPTKSPSLSPTISPSLSPTLSPTISPSLSPTLSPTLSPSNSPTLSPAIEAEDPVPPNEVMVHQMLEKIHLIERIVVSNEPSKGKSSDKPSKGKSIPIPSPTKSPSLSPTLSPSLSPTLSPTISPAPSPTIEAEDPVHPPNEVMVHQMLEKIHLIERIVAEEEEE